MIAAAEVERSLAVGRELKAWWSEVDGGRLPVERFALLPAFPGGDAVRGFSGDARLGGTTVQLMGYSADYFFDRGGSPGTVAQAADWLADQAEEFAMRYWLRAEAWALPQPYGRLDAPQPPPFLRFLDLRPRASPELCGMANLLRSFKRRRDGVVGDFPAASAREIVDLRTLETTYEWVTIEREALDLAVTYRVPGSSGLSISFPISSATTSALSADLTVRQRHPRPGVVGEFGAGFCATPAPSGNSADGSRDGLHTGLRLQTLRVLDTAEVRVRMVTIVSRSPRSAQADKQVLSAHAIHLRDALLGTRAVWQQVNDWRDPARIPEWIVKGAVT